MTIDIGIIGLWHQGIVGAAVLADWGHSVLASDRDATVIGDLRRGQSPIFEPGLSSLLTDVIERNLLGFTYQLSEAVTNKSHVLLMHDIPVDENDVSDLEGFFSDIREITPSLKQGVAILITAQVSVGTCREVLHLIRDLRPELAFTMAYCPENLRLGSAIERFRNPPLPVLGLDDSADSQLFTMLFSSPGVKWELCSLETAEMLKHALNGFLAMSVSYANELGNLCVEVGADGHQLGQLLKLDSRVGAMALTKPGLAFTGGTLARDIQSLRSLGNRHSVVTPCLDGVWESNQQQRRIVIRTLVEYFGSSFQSLQFGILGLTYKANTSTLRRSASVELIGDICERGGKVKVHDPSVVEFDLNLGRDVSIESDPINVAAESDALILMTPWDMYKTLNFVEVKLKMRGKFVFDTARLWDAVTIHQRGFDYVTIGSRVRVGT